MRALIFLTGFLLLADVCSMPPPADGGSDPTISVQLVDAEAGVAQWPVVVGPQAAETVRVAAQDLAKMLGRITGTPFAVIEGDGRSGIAVGAVADFPALDWAGLFDPAGVEGREQYLLRSHEDGLWLVGARPIAAQHAVWDLLQRLGYRYYFPSPAWEIVPSIRAPVVALDVFARPDYFVRRVGGTLRMGSAPWLQEGVSQWQIRNRAASDFGLSTGHAYQFIVRRNQAVFNAHPEYLALVDGERRGNKMCISNPGLRAFVAQDAVKHLRANPEQDSISMEPSDGGGWCECPACEALGTPSDRAVILANDVAAAINEIGLGPKYVGIYAYNWHSPPPSIAVHPNVIVSLESTHLRQGTTLEEMLAGWGAQARLLGKRETYARSFTSDSGFLPGASRAADLPYIQQTLPHWHAHGVRFLIGGGNAHWGGNGLGTYVAARILWNIEEADRAQEIVDEFLELSFGPAAEAMRGYFTAVNRATETPWVPGLSLPVEQRIGRMYRALAKARPLAPDAAVRARIDDLILYTRLIDLYQQARGSQEDFDALVSHLWRMRERNMADTINMLVYLERFVTRRDDAIEHIGRRPADRHRVRENDPFSDEEIVVMLAQGTAAYPTPDVDVEVADFGPGLTPAGFDFGMDVRRGAPPFYGTEGHRGNLTLELWTRDRELPVLFFSAGHCWPGRGPLRWTLHDQQGVVIKSGEIPSNVHATRQPVSGGREWRAAESTHALRLEVPEPGVYRLDISNTGQGFFWDYDSRPDAGLAIRADTATPLRNQWLDLHYFYVPRGVREIQLWGELRAGRHAWIRPDGKSVPADAVRTDHGFTLVPVPEGMDGQVWSLQSRHSRPELRFLNIPGLLAYHPSELVVPRKLAAELPRHVPKNEIRSY